MPGMVNVVNKMCEVPNCFKRPSLNYPGVRPAVRPPPPPLLTCILCNTSIPTCILCNTSTPTCILCNTSQVRCGEHKLEGMTNAFRKSSSSKSSSGGSKGVAEPRVKTSDGDTTDSGSDGDEAGASPAAAASCSGSPAHHAAAAAAAADASSPSAKPDSAAGASHFCIVTRIDINRWLTIVCSRSCETAALGIRSRRAACGTGVSARSGRSAATGGSSCIAACEISSVQFQGSKVQRGSETSPVPGSPLPQFPALFFARFFSRAIAASFDVRLCRSWPRQA